MYGGGTPWGYINAKNRADRAEREASSARYQMIDFQSKYSIWLGEEADLVKLLDNELQKAKPNLTKIKKISDDMMRHVEEGSRLVP